MLQSWWIEHKGILIGTSVGICLGLIYLLFGFWHMIVFLWIVGISAWIGKQFDNKDDTAFVKIIWQKVKDRRKR